MVGHLRKGFWLKGVKAALFPLIFLIISFVMAGSVPASSASNPAFDVATLDKMTDFPVQWVAAGGGVLAYGAGGYVDFALENEPFSPVSELSFDGKISGALIVGGYAYLAQEGLGLRVIGLDVPSSPVDIGFYPLSGTTFHLANWGNLLFVGGVNQGIQIFELSTDQQDRGQPQVNLRQVNLPELNLPELNLIDRGVIPLDLPATAMTAEKGKLYVATTGKEIKILDVSDPSSTPEMGSFFTGLPAQSMAISGGSLFVAAGAEGLHVLDLSAPGKAETVANYPVYSESLYPAGRLVFLAAGAAGLHLLNAGPLAATTFQAAVGPNGRLIFNPSTININTGDSVFWTWGSSFHSATSGTNCTHNAGANAWDSGELDEGSTFQFTFNTAGTFPYFSSVSTDCSLGMVGTVNVAGATSGVNISISPPSVDFGNVNVGQFSDQTITITNQVASTGTLTGSAGTLTAPYSIVSGGGAFSLTPGQSVMVTVRFSPTAAGPAPMSLSITHNATNQTNPTSITLSGTGVTPGGPGVVVSSVSGPGTGKPGGRISIQNTVTNQGAQTASTVTVNFFLSTDMQIGTGDTLVGKRTIRNLAPGASSGPVSTTVTIPRNLPPGSYFLGATAGNSANFDSNGITLCLSLLKPTLLSPKNRGTNISSAPVLDWSDVTGASIYEVQVATDRGFTNVVATVTGLTDNQWTVTPALSSGAAYFWRVRAVNVCNSGPWSALWSFKTL